MRLLSSRFTRALTCAAAVCVCGGGALALTTGLAGPATAGPKPGYAVTLLSGGGRIWEGESVSRPTADITFGGHIEKFGPGNESANYRCTAGEPDPPDPLYDTNWEFSIYQGTSARAYLDSGNLQSKVETTTP